VTVPILYPQTHEATSEVHANQRRHAALDAVIAPVLAAQAAADEHKRRADWCCVENNAAKFATGMGS